MLAAHSGLSCGPESHFFDKLSRKRDVGTLYDPRLWPQAAVDHLFSVRHCGRPVPDNYELSREQLTAYLGSRPPSVAAILGSLTEQYMVRVGKRRWVEKSPSHCQYVHTVRRYFPRSPIVRILRDPRDVALSLLNVPWGVKSLLDGVWEWLSFDQRSASFFEQDPRAYTLRYEDLVDDPEKELKRLCGFLGEAYEPGMLDTSRSSRHTNRTNEPWKVKAGEPPDRSRIRAWSARLAREENRQVEALVGDRLRAYGYEVLHSFRGLASVYPLEQLETNSRILAGLCAEGYRLWHEVPGEKPALRLYLGDPDRAGWLPATGHLRRLLRTLRIGSHFLRCWLRRQPVHWVHDRATSRGLSGRLLGLLRPFTRDSELAH
jgi:hypothetical protein